VLLRLGRLDEARAAARRALELGGARPEYLDTRDSIERACAAAGTCR
jgi:hypothetical protein